MIDIGKAVIAAVLCRFETNETLFSYKDNWLRYIYNNLNTTFDDFGENKLSVVTFNYDRTVEHFLFQSLLYTYNKRTAACTEAMRQIPIIHLHGRLGNLAWQGPAARSYGQPLDAEGFRACKEGIKIIHEDITDGRDKDFLLAKNLMQSGKGIVFMGFGYYRINMDRLGIVDFTIRHI